MRKILPFLLTLFSAISCTPGRVYNERLELPDMIWDENKAVKFEVPVEDTSAVYDVKIELRTVDFYQFSNLWLYFKTIAPSKKTSADTLECILYDEKGMPLSTNKMRFGEIEDYEFTFKKNVGFPEKGTYTFYIQHGMRAEKLPYVKEIGLILDKHNNN